MRAVKYGYTKEERNLLRYSDHIISDYPDLYEYVKKNEKAFSGNVDTSTDKGKSLDILFTRNNQLLSNIIKELQLEWMLDKSEPTEDPEKKLVCELCGQTGLRLLHPLTNRRNQKTMRIGTECVKKYDLGKSGAEGDNYEEFLLKEKFRQRMNSRELDANLKSNNALIRNSLAKYKWENIPYLPSVEITQEIVNLIQKEIPSTLQPIRDTTQSLTPELLNHCDKLVTRLQLLLDMAYEEIGKPSSEWRVSNAVYKWAKEKAKKKKSDAELVKLLESFCNINSENVALITEEGHKMECLKRISRELPSNFRIKTDPGQTDRIKIYLSIDRNEYPFWIPYKLLIMQAAKCGFPQIGSLLSFSAKDLLSCVARIDIQDGRSSSLYLQSAIHEIGASVMFEDESGAQYLISRQKSGFIYDTEYIIQFLTVAILSGENEKLLRKLKEQINGGNWMPIDVAKENWKEFHRD